MFKNIYYKILVLLFYYAGDICCRINTEWTGNLYQKFMLRSLKYDENIGFWLWKEPSPNSKNL